MQKKKRVLVHLYSLEAFRELKGLPCKRRLRDSTMLTAEPKLVTCPDCKVWTKKQHQKDMRYQWETPSERYRHKKVWCILIGTTWHASHDWKKPQKGFHALCANDYWGQREASPVTPFTRMEFRVSSCRVCRFSVKREYKKKIVEMSPRKPKMYRTRPARVQDG